MEMQKKHRWFLITLLNFITLLFVFYVHKKKKLVMQTKCNSCTFGLEYMQTTGSSITTMLVFGSQRRRHHSCVPFIPALDYELWSFQTVATFPAV